MTSLKTSFREVFCIIIRSMNRQVKRIINNFIPVITLVTIANVLLAVPGRSHFYGKLNDVIAFIIYEGLLAYWGISVMRRIMHVRVRRYLIISDLAMIFWVLIRCLKWYVFFDPAGVRFLYYCYYIPQLLIAYCVFCVSESIREKNIKRFRNNRGVVLTVTIVLSVLMLTNEYHHIAFLVNEETGAYTHFVGYLVVAFWIGSLIIYSVLRLPKNTERTGKDRSLVAPYSMLGIGLLFCFFTLLNDYLGWGVHISYAECFSLITIGFWESLIQTGKVPFNSDYTWCFNHSSVKVQVLDHKGKRIYSSIEARNLTKDEVRSLLNKGVSHQNEDIELKAVPIKGGYAVWERDNTDINKSIRRLRETVESVAEAKESLEETLTVEKKHQSINEQNRLYDITFKAVSDKFDKLLKLIEKAYKLEGEALKEALVKIDIIGVYVKRKINLLLLSQTDIKDYAGELNLCFKESFDNLKDAGLESSYAFYNVQSINYEAAEFIYTAFENCIEENLDRLVLLNAIISSTEDTVSLMTNMVSKKELSLKAVERYKEKSGIEFEMESDSDEVTVSFHIKKGGSL